MKYIWDDGLGGAFNEDPMLASQLAVQQISIVNHSSTGSIQLSMLGGRLSTPIDFAMDYGADAFRIAMESISGVGRVDVQTSSDGQDSHWNVTFLDLHGDLAHVEVLSLGLTYTSTQTTTVTTGSGDPSIQTISVSCPTSTLTGFVPAEHGQCGIFNDRPQRNRHGNGGSFGKHCIRTNGLLAGQPMRLQHGWLHSAQV